MKSEMSLPLDGKVSEKFKKNCKSTKHVKITLNV